MQRFHSFAMLLLSLALLVCLVSAQSTQLNYPPPGTNLSVGSTFTVQVGMGGYPENIDVVAIVIGLMPCYGGECQAPDAYLGDILYQGPYTPQSPNYFANYTVQVPQGFPTGLASLNVLNLFLVGASYAPNVDYLSEEVNVVSA